MSAIAPGLYPDLAAELYHADHGVGSSCLKVFKRSPLHYWTQCADPKRITPEPTPAQKVGTAYHFALFEPETFADRYTIVPSDVDRRTKAGKQAHAELLATGRELIDADAAADVLAMAAVVHKHPMGRALLGTPNPWPREASIFVEVDGLTCKIRPDFCILPCEAFPNGLIVDGKSTDDAREDAFGRSVWRYEYGFQAAYYVDMWQRHFRTAGLPPFIWLAQEKAPPYAPAFYSASREVLTHGRSQYEPLLEQLARCRESNTWPGYPTGISELILPAWAEKLMGETVDV
jgi:exodeoxyribonuclease VIII